MPKLQYGEIICHLLINLLRFWTMANTFTGLKLQGQLGKFGAKELSDIEGQWLFAVYLTSSILTH